MRDIKAGKPTGTAEQKKKAEKSAGFDQLLPRQMVHGWQQLAKAPRESQNARRNAEGDDVCERIELLAKVAHRIRHACDAAVQRVKWNGEKYG